MQWWGAFIMTKPKFRTQSLTGGDTLPGKAVQLYRRHDTPTLAILNAVNDLWREIQNNHPGTPNVNIVLQASERAHGHFAPSRWEGSAQYELMLSTVSLALATNDGRVRKTVSTLLHEAAHAYAFANKIQDTSRQGRWHNKKFATLAEQFGCIVEPNVQIGHVTSGITPLAYVTYKSQIDALATAITSYSRSSSDWLQALIGTLPTGLGLGPVPAKPRRTYGSQTVTVICECAGAGYRIPRDLYETTDIRCNECDSAYTERY